MGKHNMSILMTTQQKQESFRNFPLQIQNKDTKNTDISSNSKLLSATIQNHPHLFKLPASSPYDNFLKAAGC